MTITPDTIRQAYKFTDVQGKSGSFSGQAFAAFEQAEFKQSDVNYFLNYYKLPAN
jgi:hypothetical protein